MFFSGKMSENRRDFYEWGKKRTDTYWRNNLQASKKQKKSQKELAEKADISDVHLSRIENGVVSMNILTFVKIAKALSVREGEIFDFK